MEGTRPRGRPTLRWKYIVKGDLKAWNFREEWATNRERWKDTVRRDLKAWNIRKEWATDRERWNGLWTRYPAQGDGGERGERDECTDRHTLQVILQNRFAIGLQPDSENWPRTEFKL